MVQWLVFAAVWLLLTIPIFKVTRSSTVAADYPPAAQAGEETGWISLRFSSDPGSFSIRQQGQMVWTEERPAGRFFEEAVPLRMDPDGVEFVVSARVPEVETAIEVAFEASGRPHRQYTIWGEGAIEETVSFSWPADE